MPLTALQSHNIEKAIAEGRSLEAVKLYREATHCDLLQAKTAIDGITADLRQRKPWLFRGEAGAAPTPAKTRISPKALLWFLLVDAIIFGGVMFYFFAGDRPPTRAASVTTYHSSGTPKSISLPEHIAERDYSAALDEGDTFRQLYERKIDDAAYQRRKSGDSRAIDTSVLERKIKTARSKRAAQRSLPADQQLIALRRGSSTPQLNGVLTTNEWEDASRFVLDEHADTRLYLKVVGEWLYIACDAPAETSSGGYDQLRVYFHAGLLSKLVNERIHVGRSGGVTSIRQTRFRWQGLPAVGDRERWKKYPISDWGLYQHAYGMSSMNSGHRQYEAAVHLGEAGLHPGVPFTLYAEVETDPLRTAEGKFVERRYLGQLGNARQPLWLQF